MRRNHQKQAVNHRRQDFPANSGQPKLYPCIHLASNAGAYYNTVKFKPGEPSSYVHEFSWTVHTLPAVCSERVPVSEIVICFVPTCVTDPAIEARTRHTQGTNRIGHSVERWRIARHDWCGAMYESTVLEQLVVKLLVRTNVSVRNNHAAVG